MVPSLDPPRYRCARSAVSAFFSIQIAKDLVALLVNISVSAPPAMPGYVSNCSRRKAVGHFTDGMNAKVKGRARLTS